MDTLEYYKLKDELSGLIRSEVATNIGNERDLQQKYIGIGLKVAAFGLAAAVVALSIFGVKSLTEISAAIDKIPDVINKRADTEITQRFNTSNPVAAYEVMLLDSAARSVATSLTMQAERSGNIIFDERISTLITTALLHKEIKNATKLSLIYALSSRKIRAIAPPLDQAITTVFRDFVTERVVAERSLARCVRYFNNRTPEQYVPVLDKAFDASATLPKVRLAIARYTADLDKGYGAELIRKLEQSTDLNIRYLMHIKSLKADNSARLDRSLINDVLATAFVNNAEDDDIGLAQLIDHIEALNEDGDDTDPRAADFVDIIRGYAAAKNLALAIDADDSSNTSFHFYNAAGSSQSAAMNKSKFESLFGIATKKMIEDLKKKDGDFDDAIKADMHFWFPRAFRKAQRGQMKAAVFGVGSENVVRFKAKDGSELLSTSLGHQAIVTTQTNGPAIDVVLKWTAETGESRSVPIVAIADFKPDDLRPINRWGRWDVDDGSQ